jgi:hypothetical protein
MAQDLCNQSRVRACTKSTQIYISGLVQRVLLLVRQFVVVDVLVIEPGGAWRDVGNHGNLHGTIKGGGDGMWGFEDGMWRCANRLPRLAQGVAGGLHCQVRLLVNLNLPLETIIFQGLSRPLNKLIL